MADVYITIEPMNQQIIHIWRTSVQKSINGKEKRSSLFTWPRINLMSRFNIVDRARIAWLRRMLFKYSDGTWGIPIWPDKTTLTAQATAGTSSLPVVQTDYRHFYDDRKAIIIDPSAVFPNYEVVTISSFTSTTITISGTLSATWPADSYVLPLYEFRLDSKLSMLRQNHDNYSAELFGNELFESQPGFTYSVPSSGAGTYLSYDVFLDKPQSSQIKYDFERPFETSKFLGLAYTENLFTTGQMYQEQTHLYSDRQDVRGLLNFFDSKRGDYQTFWYPSWERDIIPSAAIDSADTVINVEDYGYDETWVSEDLAGRHVMISFPDRTYVFRKINSATATTITLDSAIGTSVKAERISEMMFSFLNYGVFDIPEIKMEYTKEEVVRSTVRLRNVIGESI